MSIDLGIVSIILSLSALIISLAFSLYGHYVAKKTTSAKILLEMSKRMEQQDFRKTMKLLHSEEKPDKDRDEQIEIERLLTYFEDMGLYEDEGILKIKHIDQMHRYTLKLLKKDDRVKKILEKYSDGDDADFYFVFVKKLFAQYS